MEAPPRDVTELKTFRLRAPLLREGNLDVHLAESDILNVRLKSYARGGENALHAHTEEDHIFVVLQGQVRFYDQDDRTKVLGRGEGILIPRQTYYRFNSCGEEPLIMLRVGGCRQRPAVPRVGPDGRPLPGFSKENKHVEPVPIEGAFYDLGEADNS